jgi:hypothetical protein
MGIWGWGARAFGKSDSDLGWPMELRAMPVFGRFDFLALVCGLLVFL